MNYEFNEESEKYADRILRGVWERLESVVRIREVSRGQLADYCGVSPSFFFYGRNPDITGKPRDLSVSVVAKCCASANVDMDWLIYGKKKTFDSKEDRTRRVGVSRDFILDLLANTVQAAGTEDWSAFIMALLPYISGAESAALQAHVESYSYGMNP